MFRNDLFNHSDFENIENGFKTVIVFNWEHPGFKGHFPSRPVVPGVLLMQMVKECFETFLAVSTVIEGADLKFTKPVTPQTAPELKLEVTFANDNDRYKVKSGGHDGETKFFKINMELVKGGLQ